MKFKNKFISTRKCLYGCKYIILHTSMSNILISAQEIFLECGALTKTELKLRHFKIIQIFL